MNVMHKNGHRFGGRLALNKSAGTVLPAAFIIPVAWSSAADSVCLPESKNPDCATLHPGYWLCRF